MACVHTCCLAILCAFSALAIIPAPRNVRVLSYNMDTHMEWDPPLNWSERITYTVEFKGYYSNNKTLCQNVTECRCNVSKDIRAFGMYTFKVRSESQGDYSEWISTKEFLPDRDTSVGPPNVTLQSKDGEIEVTLQDPVFRDKGFTDIYSVVIYNVYYWEKGDERTMKWTNSTNQRRLMLRKLKSWTRYCVRAHVYLPTARNTGQMSNVTCENTTSDGKVQAWVVVVVLLGSFVAVAVMVPLIFLCVWYLMKGLKLLYPSVKLPEHFKQYLMEPPRSNIFLAMQNPQQEGEVCHSVVIVPNGPESTEVNINLADSVASQQRTEQRGGSAKIDPEWNPLL